MLQNLKINDIPKDQRPREKLLTYGSESLSDEELLAIVLRTGSKNEDVIQLATSIIRNLGGLQGLFKSSPKELMKIHGVKEAKATQILALCELYRRFRTTCIYQQKISKPSDIVEVVIDDIGHLMQEVFVLVTLDTKNKIISKKKLFVGSLNSSLVHPREIFKEALKDSAASIIVCHNHPSGDPTPSKEDIDITLRVKECGKIMGIELLDHIILGKNKFLSLKEKAIL